jgi:hypothetical protein
LKPDDGLAEGRFIKSVVRMINKFSVGCMVSHEMCGRFLVSHETQPTEIQFIELEKL